MNRTGFLLALLLSVTTLGACSGDGDHALGEAVEIDYYDGATAKAVGSGTVEVTAVRDGSTTELEDAGFSLDPDEKAATAYYVDATFENGGDATVTPRSPGAEDPDGNLISALTVIDLGGEPFEPCPGVPETVDPGQSAEGCSIILVPEGREMEKISYHPGGSDDFIYWKTE